MFVKEKTISIGTCGIDVYCINCNNHVNKPPSETVYKCKKCGIGWKHGKARFTLDDNLILVKPPNNNKKFTIDEDDETKKCVKNQFIINQINNLLGYSFFKYDYEIEKYNNLFKTTSCFKNNIKQQCLDLINNKDGIVDKLIEAKNYNII